LKKLIFFAALCAAGALCLATQAASAQQAPASRLNISDGKGHAAHIFPTVKYARQLGMFPSSNAATCAFGNPCLPLTYHGGPVMVPFLSFYIIYWSPAHLQDGTGGPISAAYEAVENNMVAGYGGHPLAANNTQYYSTGRATSYIDGMSGLAGVAVDATPYPVGGCTDSGVPNPSNCISDAALETEIQNVMAAHSWSGGINKMFLVFTDQNEGECFNASDCSYVQFCAYHTYFTSGGLPVIYGNEPYGDTTICQVSGTPSPNSNPNADAAATAASHEMTEAITDPELNAWYDSNGLSGEIGDECAYIYGTNTWDSAKANQMWNGHYFELQEEYDNHRASCQQVGP
jgi:hypothetical protein